MTGTPPAEVAGTLTIRGDALRLPLRDESVDLVVTSPPYFGLRSYGAGSGEIGSETHWRDWLQALVQATAEMGRVLKPEGSIFANLGDKYNSAASGQKGTLSRGQVHVVGKWHEDPQGRRYPALRDVPEKCLMLLPERYRIACVDQLGLTCRAVVVWDKPNCLSGGTQVYARIKGRPLAIKIHDLCRAYQPKDVQLWNGQRWTQAVHWEPTARDQNEPALEIELRSGERIGCTREHRWPTTSLHGVIRADELQVGDVLEATRIPEGETRPAALDDELIGWFIGLYIAEGSRSERTIQIAGHSKELERYKRLCELAEAFHGTCHVYANGNKATITLAGRFLDAILETYVGGRTAKDKHLQPKCWQRSNRFLRAILDGYLSGDGHYEAETDRWAIGFTNNDALAADLRALGARLGISIRLRRVTHTGFDKQWPGWGGTIVMDPNRRRRPDSEIVAIRQSRARQFWDVGVEDDPHLFALASGVLTHNSLPESVKDRVRRSHEDWVHLTKSARYYAALDEIREPQQTLGERHEGWSNGRKNGHPTQRSATQRALSPLGKLPGSVWQIPSEPLRLPPWIDTQHYAAFPTEWPRRLILAFTPPGICRQCEVGRFPVVERQYEDAGGRGDGERYARMEQGHGDIHQGAFKPQEMRLGRANLSATILGYACACTPHTDHPGTREPRGTIRMSKANAINDGAAFNDEGHYVPREGVAWREYHLDRFTPPPTRPAIVCDPFMGTGTVLHVARALGRHGVGVDLSEAYCKVAADETLARQRAGKVTGRRHHELQGVLPW